MFFISYSYRIIALMAYIHGNLKKFERILNLNLSFWDQYQIFIASIYDGSLPVVDFSIRIWVELGWEPITYTDITSSNKIKLSMKIIRYITYKKYETSKKLKFKIIIWEILKFSVDISILKFGNSIYMKNFKK